MATRTYNPGFLSDDELGASFCVRTSEFASIVETLQENTGNSNQHAIVIGSRGSGKTSLLLRVALEVRRNAELAGRLRPVVFAEESYSVGTCGEFWLECLARVAAQQPGPDGQGDLHATYGDLRRIRDEQTLADRCLGAVLDVADREGKRLVLMVENLNLLLGEMTDPDAGWQLRKTLQTEPRIMLLGSATSRFAEIDDPEHALYGLFRVLYLRPLDEQECSTLWRTVSGTNAERGKIRSLQILTGGSPRLMAMVARFGGTLSFAALMSDILDLVDDHTEYFKRHIEDLPPQERRVFVALAELWKPATTREVADQSRIGTSQCSALLQRLVARGAVAIDGGTPRRKQYYLIERMYNIYYLLRRGDAGRMVEALLRFMASFYSAPDLSSMAGSLVRALGSTGILLLNRAVSDVDPRACDRDLGALLAIIPRRDDLPPVVMHAVIGFAAYLEPVRALEQIQSSPARDLLLPLTTALQQETGLTPRVSREVREVAQDVHAKLAAARRHGSRVEPIR